MRGDQRHVDRALFELADQTVRFHRHHAHANTRRLHLKRSDKRHDDRAQGVVGRGKREGERCGERIKGDRLKQLVDICQNAFDGSRHRFRPGGRHDAVRRADKQRVFKVIPQAVKHAAYRWLGQGKTRRRAGDAAFVQQGIQRFQQVKIQRAQIRFHDVFPPLFRLLLWRCPLLTHCVSRYDGRLV